MRTLSLAVIMAIPLLSACGGSAASGGPSSTGNRYLITRTDLERLPSSTAFDAVQRFHRDWLTGRSATARSVTGRSYPQVFVDGKPFGPLDTLHQFPTEMLEMIRFIPPSDATTRYGTGYPAGIIEIITRRDSTG